MVGVVPVSLRVRGGAPPAVRVAVPVREGDAPPIIDRQEVVRNGRRLRPSQTSRPEQTQKAEGRAGKAPGPRPRGRGAILGQLNDGLFDGRPRGSEARTGSLLPRPVTAVNNVSVAAMGRKSLGKGAGPPAGAGPVPRTGVIDRWLRVAAQAARMEGPLGGLRSSERSLRFSMTTCRA